MNAARSAQFEESHQRVTTETEHFTTVPAALIPLLIGVVSVPIGVVTR
jgi:hypothetical protein